MKSIKATFAILAALLCSAPLFASDIHIEAPYVRAVPPSQSNSASFMVIHNNSDTERTLVGADSAVANVVELHEHRHENGMMKMRRIDGGIKIGAHSTATLQPGGLHIMLIGLKKRLVPGEMVAITLKFDDGSTQAIHAEIRKLAMKMDNKKMMHQHQMQ
jgi:periplasmic copper chaperone A